MIVTGHHLDDQVETVLFRIFRGTGIKGLSGIKEFSRVNNINFYRPLLKSTKEELLNYALVNNLLWVEDKSNKESKFSRNIIRNKLMPTISKRWPQNCRNRVCRTRQFNSNKRSISLLFESREKSI